MNTSDIKRSARLFKALTLHRLTNALLVLSGYFLSRWLKKPIQSGLPFSLSIEPTTACNLACPECPSGLKQFTRPTGNLEVPFFEKLIDEVAQHLIYLTFYFQGEPFIHPSFLKMVRYAASKNIYTATSTNAHFIDSKTAEEIIQSGLSELIISIDGLTQETYTSYRVNGELNKVLEGTKNVLAAIRKNGGKGPMVVFQFLVVHQNEHQIDALFRLAKELGVDKVRLKTAQIYDYENGSPLLPENQKYSRYRKNSLGKYEIKNQLLNHCWRMWHSAVITWDGNVVPCCFDKDAKYKMGSLKQRSIKEVWQNEHYSGFRKSILEARSNIDICKNCTEGTKVLM